MRDGLGGPRSTFPHTVTLAAGTQAANPKQNSLALMKLANLVQGKHGSKVSAWPLLHSSSEASWAVTVFELQTDLSHTAANIAIVAISGTKSEGA